MFVIGGVALISLRIFGNPSLWIRVDRTPRAGWFDSGRGGSFECARPLVRSFLLQLVASNSEVSVGAKHLAVIKPVCIHQWGEHSLEVIAVVLLPFGTKSIDLRLSCP